MQGYCEEVELTMMDTKNMYESQRGGEPIMFLDTPEGREWVRRLADMTFTLNCLAGDGVRLSLFASLPPSPLSQPRLPTSFHPPLVPFIHPSNPHHVSLPLLTFPHPFF